MHKAEKEALDLAVKEIIDKPLIGISKAGDLASVRVHKYKLNTQLYLIAYAFIEDEMTVTLIEQGTHENFYRDLKNH